jgi:C-terminal processing protease CtpA/Prc
MKKNLLALLIVALGVLCCAQTNPAAAPVAPAEKQAVLEALTSALNESYVFPELAAKVQRELKVQQKLGAYDKVDDGAALAALLTKQINDICKDAHLRVRYSAEILPQREDRRMPSPEEIAQMNMAIRYRNAGFEKVERLAGNVGYISFSNFMPTQAAARPIEAAMNFVADTDALIVDVRNNGGGEPETVRDICSYFFGEKPVHLNDLYFREGNQTIEFWTNKKVTGKRYLDKPIYVLSSKRTGSGAEEFCYNLQNLKRATIVGQNTWGGANPGGTVRLTDHFSAFIPTGRAINPYTKTNWEGTGVKPDVEAPAEEALKVAHLMALKKLLGTAKDPNIKAGIERAIRDLEAEAGAAKKE